jgi:uncharacterized membrane protein (UPF0127 family)
VRFVAVINESRSGADLGASIGIADTFWTRLRGLLGHRPLDRGEGLLLEGCQAVHMFGMKQALDVAFLSRDDHVVATYEDLRPGRCSRYHRDAHRALELPVGTLSQTETRVGDRLTVRHTIPADPSHGATDVG